MNNKLITQNFINSEELAIEIDKLGVTSKKMLISIDGCDGAGKTHLSKYLQEYFKGNIYLVDCDDKNNDNKTKYYDTEDKMGFFNNIYFDKILNEIKKKQNISSVIFSSILSLQILEKINIKADINIYVKKIKIGQKNSYNKDGVSWEDEYRCGCHNENDIKDWSQLHKELNKYHVKFKPHECCHFLFLREDKYSPVMIIESESF